MRADAARARNPRSETEENAGIKKFAIFLFSCLAFLTGSGDVLLWTVDENATVSDIWTVYEFAQNIPDTDTQYPSARVKVTGNDSSIYLDNYVSWDGGNTFEVDEGFGYDGVYMDTVGGRYGVFLQQSYVPTELGQELLFSIEIGQLTWDKVSDTTLFTVLAESDKYTYEIVKQHIYPTFDLNPPVTDWKPTYYYTTPEPSTSLLCLLGASLLMLKRPGTNGGRSAV